MEAVSKPLACNVSMQEPFSKHTSTVPSDTPGEFNLLVGHCATKEAGAGQSMIASSTTPQGGEVLCFLYSCICITGLKSYHFLLDEVYSTFKVDQSYCLGNIFAIAL